MRSRLAMVVLAVACLGVPARAETGLVMKDGSVVKCEGYELKGNVYILKSKDGKKVSLKADKVDPVATSEFAKKAEAMAAAQAALDSSAPAPAAAPSATPAAKPSGEGVTTLTDADLKKYKGQPSSMGDQSTVSAETPEMPSRDDYEKLAASRSDAPKEAPKDEAPKQDEPKSDPEAAPKSEPEKPSDGAGGSE